MLMLRSKCQVTSSVVLIVPIRVDVRQFCFILPPKRDSSLDFIDLIEYHFILFYRLQSNNGFVIMIELGWITKLGIIYYFLAGIESYSIMPTAVYYIESLGQTKFFLALVVCAYDVGAIFASPVAGFITDRAGNPRSVFICSCALRVIACLVYSINLSAYFPLSGRLFTGLTGMATAILLAQIALQTNEESRGRNFVLVETSYCLGTVFGPVIGSVLTFRVNVFGWRIDEGNSPGIVLAIIWLLFFIFSLILPKDIWVNSGESQDNQVNSNSSGDEDEKSQLRQRQRVDNEDKTSTENYLDTTASSIFRDQRVFCLLLLIFSSEIFSSASTFYTPILALDHFHLQLIHSKLLFLNCTLFTILMFICLYIASPYVDERKLCVVCLMLQVISIIFLTTLAIYWDRMTDIQYYILLLYVCFGMPYFLYPFGNSLLSKITDLRHATFVQGVSYATVHCAIVISRVSISFVFTKISLICYCTGMIILWLVGTIWYGVLYKRLTSDK